ncbi:uncharacterized protein LOC121754679 [Salvia splendens]|uniref:uncharacterized protein LOC121754679 n=1 Tax=Salvia splendens TaxID=180675 RepID=UPI001C278389|nr:uncharacterized protein LOC121754679 [Salvia splendens]
MTITIRKTIHVLRPAAAGEDSLEKTSPPPHPEKTHRCAKKKRNLPTRIRLSTSSADSGWFSSEGAATVADQETKTLVSSFLGSSSVLYPIREMQLFSNSNPRNPHRRSRRSRSSSTKRAPARLSVFKKLISCTVGGKVKENFAIVKKLENVRIGLKMLNV